MGTPPPSAARLVRRTFAFLALHALLWLGIGVALYVVYEAKGPILNTAVVICLIVVGFNYAGALATLCVAALCRRSAVDEKRAERSPHASKTVVGVPCLLSSRGAIEDLLDTVAAHHRSSAGSAAAIVLLADYVDAVNLDEASEGEDAALLNLAKDGVERLNRELGNVFCLLVRGRAWAPTERVWMGRERKRGKIEAFNRFLIDALDCEFETVCGDTLNLREVKYVLALDADTMLPDNALAKLIEKMDDPSNARFVIIQPGLRRAILEPKNFYQWMTTSPFPPLSILQSVFGRSKFVGKGIYDVRRFQDHVSGRVPEGWVLSHDVLESALLPVGSTDEVFVRDGNPESFEESCARLHRWFRGDWQNIPWGVPSALRYKIPEFRTLKRSKVGLVGAWMVQDLIVRDLHAPALMVLLWVGCLAQVSTDLLLGLLGCELGLVCMTYFAKRTRGEATGSMVYLIHLPLGTLFFLVSLPALAWVCVDAALRSIWRMLVSGRHRLQWIASAEFRSQVELRRFRYWTMVPSSVVGSALAVASLVASSALGLTLSIAWLLFPVIVTALERTSAACWRRPKIDQSTRVVPNEN
jgi:cyclic beta-1,2-glucan synthetase